MNLITKFFFFISAAAVFLVNSQSCRPEILTALGLQAPSPRTPGGVSSPINLRILDIESSEPLQDEYPILFIDVASTSNPLEGTYTSNFGYTFTGGQARTFSALANPGDLPDTIVIVTRNPVTNQLVSVYACSESKIQGSLENAFLEFDGGVAGTEYIVTIISQNGNGNVNYNLCLRADELCPAPLAPGQIQLESCGNGIVDAFEQCDSDSECCFECEFRPSTDVCRNADCNTCDFAGDVTCTGSSEVCPTENLVNLELFNPTAGVVGAFSVAYDRNSGENLFRALTTECYSIYDSNVYFGPSANLPVRSSTGTPDLSKFPYKLDVFARIGNLQLAGGALACPATENQVALAARVQVVSTCGTTKGVLYNAYTRGVSGAPARFSEKFPRGGATYSLLNVCYNS